MGTLPGTFFISPHPSSTCPIAPGDIEVFKGMPLTSLNLYCCEELTGVFGLGWVMVRRWGQDWKQAEAPGPHPYWEPFQEPSLVLSFFLHLPHYPRRHRVVQGHATHQLELVLLCQALRYVWSWVGYGKWGQDWKQAEAPGPHP